jgi:hypothetical protein
MTSAASLGQSLEIISRRPWVCDRRTNYPVSISTVRAAMVPLPFMHPQMGIIDSSYGGFSIAGAPSQRAILVAEIRQIPFLDLRRRLAGVAHKGGEFGDEGTQTVNGRLSSVKFVWTFSIAAAERLACATGSRVALAP